MAKKKIVAESTSSQRRSKIDNEPDSPSKARQCQLLSVPRSGIYYKPKESPQRQIEIMNAIDKIHTKYPFYGVRRLRVMLQREGIEIGRKRIASLLVKMCIQISYPKKRLSFPNLEHEIHPYLLRNLSIERVNQVWQTDITYIPMKRGFMYLMAVMDVKSRYVLHWSISNTMDKHWCCEVLKDTIAMYGAPDIFNTDQGSQFTSLDFTSILKANNIRISMDGKGRATDNAFIERLWRSLKEENIYRNAYETGMELYQGLSEYFVFYNSERPHQSLDNKPPERVFKQAA